MALRLLRLATVAALVLLTAASPGTRYKARTVAGFPFLPESCNTTRCEDGPAPPCWLEVALEKPIRQAAADGVDILVFPETYFKDSPEIFVCGTPRWDQVVPDPSPKTLCPENHKPLTWWGQVACWARQHQVLVVVGAYEWGPCFQTPEPFTHRTFPCWSNMTMFNMALAFGVDGQLLAVHHKHHLAHGMFAVRNVSTRLGNGLVMNRGPLELLNDDAAAPWPVPDAVTFTSHFGVTFGLLICHELNFASPFLSLLKKCVKDVIFPTMWGGFLGTFAGLQNGLAIVHGVNLLAANGLGGGSGIWPADASAAPVQYPVYASVASPIEQMKPQWFATLELTSPELSVAPEPVLRPPSPHRIVTNLTRLTVSAANATQTTAEVSLDDFVCQLSMAIPSGGSSYVFGVSKGISASGVFESSCWLVRCNLDVMISPTFLSFAFFPYTEEEIKFCTEQSESRMDAQHLQIRVRTAQANLFVPIGHCNNGSVPLPRPSMGMAGETGWRTMSLNSACPLDYAAVRTYAQTEFQEPQCPDGFCPSPSLCKDPSWPVTSLARCLLVPAVSSDGAQVGQPMILTM